jgi:hypothetical protein
MKLLSQTLHRLFIRAALAVCGTLKLSPAGTSAAEPPQPACPEISAVDNARIAWWTDARYGLFIHWGVASIPGVEISWDRKAPKPLDIRNEPAGAVEDPVYDNLYKTWNPEKFRAGGEMYSLAQVIRTLGSCATGDDSLLLNTGPMPDGRIEPRQVERLKKAGDWLAKHGNAIYGTLDGPASSVACTRANCIKRFAMMVLLAGLPPASADEHHAAMEERAAKTYNASLVQARPKTQNIAFPWLALWHLRRGENEEGLRILYELLDCTPPANQGHPFLSYGLAHLWLHYGHLYDEAYQRKWKELVRARSSYSYNLDPFPNNYTTTNLRMTGSVTWYLSNLGLKPNELPQGYAPADDPDRSKYLRRSIQRIARTGMPEFGSRPYGGLNALPLLCLAEQTVDKDLARRAAVVYEAYLATVAPTWLQGHWATATQRSYTDTLNQSTRSGINFLWTYFGGLPDDGGTNGMAGAAMAYRPPGYLAEIANRRNHPYEALTRASWNKDDDPDIRTEPTGFLQTTWMEPTYAVYAQMTAPRTRLQELQIYGNGVMWVDPDPKATSCLWVTVPTGGTGHTHGSPELGAEYVHHERSLLFVAKPEEGEAFPWIKGNVPANRLAMIDDSAMDGRLYLAYHGVLLAITTPSPFTWNPNDPIQLDHVTKPKVRKPGDTAPVDGFYRITSGPFAVAIDSMPPADAKGATPAARLAWFREQVRAKTRLTAKDGSAEYRSLGGA